MANALEEQNVKKKYAARLQILSKAWKQKHKNALAHRQKLLSARAAGFYDKDPTRDYMLNLINRGVATIVPFLVEGNPKIMVNTKIPNYKPYAFATQLALNFLIQKMRLDENVLIPAAINSVFGMGIVRTFREYDRVISIDNEVIKTGTPRVIVIDDSNYIGDPSAKTRADFMIEGDVYRLPTEYAKDLFSKYADDIEPTHKLVTKFGAEEIAQTNFDWQRMNLDDYSTFIDIYNYAERTICTIMPEGNKAVILREVEYDGPGKSPYDVLGYNYHPESPIAIPPAWDWHPIDVSANLVAKTAKEQAESQKNVIMAEPAAKKAAEKILKAHNMDVVLTKNAEGVKTISIGGVNPDNYNWLAFAENAFTKTGPNPDVLRGSGPAADTLGQEQIIYNNAARIVNNYYTRFHGFMSSIVEKLAWYVWTDPTVYVPFVEKIPGVGELPIIFSGADKVGDFYDFVFNVKEYST